MTKIISKLFVFCLLVLPFSKFSLLSAMELPSPLDNLPTNVKLSLLAAPNELGSPQIPFVLTMMQVSREYKDLATDGHLWQQLAQMEGFSTHHSQAYKAHYHYHRALALLKQDPTHQDPDLVATIISSLNTGAALLHEGAVTQLINLMNSEAIPLDTPFIYLPEWLDLKVYPLLSFCEIIKSSPEDMAVHYLKSGSILIKNNERAKNKFYNYVQSKELNYMISLYDILISHESWKDVKTKKIPLFLTGFIENVDKLMISISKAYREKEIVVLDLIMDYLNHVKVYTELITLPEDAPLIISEEYEKIRLTTSKAIKKLTLYHSSEYFDMVYDENEIVASEDPSQKSASYQKRNLLKVLKAFESGNISPYWIDQLNDFSQYLPPISTLHGCKTAHPITIYASLLQQKLFFDYPPLCFSEEILGTHIYTDQLDPNNPGYLGNDDYRGTILDLRRCLFWIALAKLDNGSSYHHQCMEFLEVFNCNQLFFSGFSPQVVDFFDLGNGGDQFYENYLGSSDKLDFLTCLAVSNSLKLTDLYHTDDQEELAVIFEALSQSHSQRGEYETSLIDAKRAFNINPELYLSTLFDAFLQLDRYNEAFELLRSDNVRQFCDPEEIHELELSLHRER